MNGTSDVEVGFQAYLEEGGEPFGAVRGVREGDKIVVYVENAGEFDVPADALQSVHDGKIILDFAKLDEALREAIAHAHDAEERGL